MKINTKKAMKRHLDILYSAYVRILFLICGIKFTWELLCLRIDSGKQETQVGLFSRAPDKKLAHEYSHPNFQYRKL